VNSTAYAENSAVEQLTPNQIYLAAEKSSFAQYQRTCEEALRQYNAEMGHAMAQYRRALKMAPTALDRRSNPGLPPFVTDLSPCRR